MCLIAFNWQPDEPRKLTLVANRDEFYRRDASPMAEWPEHPGLYAGKDLQQGGTWLGISQQQRFAALTNIRAPGKGPDDPKSRGQLVLDFLTSGHSAEQYMKQLRHSAAEYGLFNLLCFDGQQLWYSHNHPDAVAMAGTGDERTIGINQPGYQAMALTPGIYGLSNALLDTPWPKTQLAKRQLQQWLQQSDALPGALLDHRNAFPDEQLPATGVPLLWERLLSSQFIHTPEYGTRCSTSISIDEQWASIYELSWGDDGQPQGEFRHQFRI